MTHPHPRASDTSDRELVEAFAYCERRGADLHVLPFLGGMSPAAAYRLCFHRLRGRILARMKRGDGGDAQWAAWFAEAYKDQATAYRTALLAANERRKRAEGIYSRMSRQQEELDTEAATYCDKWERAEEEIATLRARLAEVEAERDGALESFSSHFLAAESRAEKAERERDEAVAERDYQNAAARELARSIRRHTSRVRELEAGCDKWERAEARLDALADEVWRRSDVPIDLRKKARALLTGEPGSGAPECGCADICKWPYVTGAVNCRRLTECGTRPDGEPEGGEVCAECGGSTYDESRAPTASAPFGFPCGRCQGSGREPEGGEG